MQKRSEQDDLNEINQRLDELLGLNNKWNRFQQDSLKACRSNPKAGLQLFYDESKIMSNDPKITTKMLEDRHVKNWHACMMSNFLFRIETLHGKVNKDATSRFADGVKNAFHAQAKYCEENSQGFFKKFIPGTPKKSECKEIRKMIHVIDDYMNEINQKSIPSARS